MAGIPGARSVHHVGLTVPALEEAVDFFTEVLGAAVVYRLDTVEDPKGQWIAQKLDVHPDSTVRLALLRLGPTTNLELFEYSAPDQSKRVPKASDVGGHHLAIQVEDIDKANDYLRGRPEVRLLGSPGSIEEGPLAGDRWVYFTTPWGLQLEVIEIPAEMASAEGESARMFTFDGTWEEAGSRS
ncbi:VOC family protein [Nocardiopsis metallicus]|uniref:Catechol 2,3-dioxygenase-like lactoylglutathione lyase family enzyme n=1 Tax=Nocardiopsis metallicus TaxID=179819 RepID=A0A840WI18_9ACTN|nr:VOC family protein [Nocardiopsis metallicus]MBB5489718.1 catechol 2,3-dioxygenase-like lactoylglutathione lyase family enzyme [Nocardiopsis metallicus]